MPTTVWRDVPAGQLADVDITTREFAVDPYGFWARLREDAPVQPVRWGRGGTAWLVTRYGDVEAALRDPRLRKNRREALTYEQLAAGRRVPKVFASLERGLLGLDGTDHDRLRRLVHQAFTPRRIELMREDAESVSQSLLDTGRRRGSMDLVGDYAAPLPLIMIARIIGVPEMDIPRFRRWTRGLLSIGERPVRGIGSVLLFLRYLRRMVTDRTRRPRTDLVSALVAARDAGDQLTTDEIVAMLLLLLTAGHETTVNLIASGTLALLEHPDQADLLRESADDVVVVRTAVEELLRFIGPVQTATERWAECDVEVGGVTIRQGALVLAVTASANRDPAVFDRPDELDLTRSPNPHLAFGKGVHYCLGAPLARLEAQIAIPTLLRGAPQLRRPDPGSLVAWRGGPIVRGIETLPVLLS